MSMNAMQCNSFLSKRPKVSEREKKRRKDDGDCD